MREAGDESAQQVEDHEPQVAKAIFDVIAKNEQVQHVRADVEQPTVQEHAGEQGGPGEPERRRRTDLRAARELDGHHTGRGEQEVEGALAGQQELVHEDDDVDHQDGEHDPREQVPLAWIVLEGDQSASPSVYFHR